MWPEERATFQELNFLDNEKIITMALKPCQSWYTSIQRNTGFWNSGINSKSVKGKRGKK